MWDALVKVTPHAAPWVALCVSAVTGYFGIRGYLLSKSIQSESKSDEVLVPGVLHNPSLDHPDHENCVIQTKLFNKSKRKAYVNKVVAFDGKGEEIEITWSDQIDKLGNPQGNAKLIGIVDSAWLCIRRNDGEAFRSARVEISHSFDHPNPLVLSYDMAAGWQEYFAK